MLAAAAATCDTWPTVAMIAIGAAAAVAVLWILLRY